jgi:hypothetical protein
MWGYDTHACHAVRGHWSTHENIQCHILYHSIICVNVVYSNSGTVYSLRETPEVDKNGNKLNTVHTYIYTHTHTHHSQTRHHTTHDSSFEPLHNVSPNHLRIWSQLICRTSPPSGPRPLPATPTFPEFYSRSVALSPLDWIEYKETVIFNKIRIQNDENSSFLPELLYFC